MHTARYSYYRRCQEFRGNGEQCKAPAEKGAQVCHAHAGQKAMALRRERERHTVLAEAVAQMRKRGNPEFEMANLFTNFKGIQVTIAVMAQALIEGRIDCKTAGRLAVDLQMMSKLLWMARRHGAKQILPQICADERRSNGNELQKALPKPRKKSRGKELGREYTRRNANFKGRRASISARQGLGTWAAKMDEGRLIRG
jgi:hypothetical protein